jgi:hypothetical protein
MLPLVLLLVVVTILDEVQPVTSSSLSSSLLHSPARVQSFSAGSIVTNIGNWLVSSPSRRSLRATNGDASFIDTGFIEFDAVLYNFAYTLRNRTIVPVGRCVRNVLTDEGSFMKILVQRVDFLVGSFPILIQGYSDPDCDQQVSQPAREVTQPAWVTTELFPFIFMNAHYEPHRSKHALGLTLHWYNNVNCRGAGHIDQYSIDNFCHRGYLLNSTAFAYYTDIYNNQVVEFADIWCSQPLVAYALSSLRVGECQQDGTGFGFRISIGTGNGGAGSPTMPPSLARNYTELSGIDQIYSGRLTSDESVAYFQFSYDQAADYLGVILNIETGDANLYVSNMDRCSVSSTCFSCAVDASNAGRYPRHKVCRFIDIPGFDPVSEPIECSTYYGNCMFHIAVERRESSISKDSTTKFSLQISSP